jgi:O-antigen/teichoic acid export membrane protein
MLRRLTSNALANLTTGVSGTIFQISTTALAARAFGKDGFGVWALAMSMAGWVPLFSANLSTIVTRRLIESPADSGVVLAAGLHIARRLCAVAVFIILVLSVGLIAHAQALANTGTVFFLSLVLLLTLAQLWQISYQPTFGQHFARQQNWQVARTVISSRTGALISLGVFYLLQQESQLGASLCMLIGTLAGLLIGGHRTQRHRENRSGETGVEEELARIRPLLRAFILWSVGSAVIQNGLPAFVSVIAPTHFNGFYLAYTLNMVVVGTIGAASGALLAPLAQLRTTGDHGRLHQWLMRGPAMTGLALLVILQVIWHALPWLLSIWSSGVADVVEVKAHLFWLSIQTAVRSMCLVFSVLLSSAGQAADLRRPILLELAITVFVGLPLGWLYGDMALLAAVAAAGWITSIHTCWTTLTVDTSLRQARARLLNVFVLSQLGVALSWFALTR